MTPVPPPPRNVLPWQLPCLQMHGQQGSAAGLLWSFTCLLQAPAADRPSPSFCLESRFTTDQVVSSDFIHDSRSSIEDVKAGIQL